MKIGQYADIQAKVRLQNLSGGFMQSFFSIESIIYEEEPEIVVIPGDLFEYPEPNDIERELIYKHIINILKIPSVKEVVAINGNHDYDSENKLNSAIKTFAVIGKQLLSDTEIDLMDKFLFLDKSKPTESKFNDKIVYLPYCIEDGGVYTKSLYKDINLDDGNYYIGIFHDILFDYVTESKIPVKNLKRLFKITDFNAHLILGGDIHENWNIDNFYYSGSTIQRNHGEGSYLNFYGENKCSLKKAPNKFVNFIDVNLDDKTKSKYEKIIDNSLHYVTIDLSKPNSNCDYDFIINKINSELEFLAEKDCIFKIKLSTDYQKYRNDLLTVLSEKSLYPISIKDIKTIDDSLKNSVELDNGVVEVKSLTKEIVVDLFENALVKVDDGTKIFNNVRTDIINLFKTNLELIFDNDRSYQIDILNIGTNSFQKLGPNTIDCNFHGLCRIEATNGYGKTQFFNSFYWLRYGIVYPYLNKREKTYNNMLVFNNKRSDIDDMYVVGEFNINNTYVTIKRSVKRFWKNNISDFMKKSANKHKYISKTTSELEINIYGADGVTVKSTIKNDNAEELMNRWFGNVVDNLMIINYDKLKNLINQQPENLEKLLIDYIGNDFIKSMIKSLPEVKEKELEGINKPAGTLDQLQNKLLELKTEAKIKDKTYTDNVDKLMELNSKITEANSNVTFYSDKLIKLGDIPELISKTNKSIDENQKFINEYKTVDKKPLLNDLELTKPEKPLFLVDFKLDENSKKLSDLSLKIELSKNILKESIDNKIVEISKQFVENKVSFNLERVEHGNKLFNNYITSEFIKLLTNKKSEYENKLSDKEKLITQIDVKLDIFNADLIKLKNQIETGVCSECETVLADEKIIEQTKEKLSKIENDVQQLKEAKNKTLIIVENLKTKIDDISEIFNTNNFDKCNVDFLTKHEFENVDNLIVDTKNKLNLLNEFNKDSQELQSDFDNKFVNFVDKFNLKSEVIDKIKNNIKQIKILNEYDIESAENIAKLISEENVLKKSINAFNVKSVEYNKLITEYNNSITEHNKKVEEILQFNSNVDKQQQDYNSKLTLIENDKKLLLDYESKLPDYTSNNESLIENRNLYNSLKSEIETLDKEIDSLKFALGTANNAVEICKNNINDMQVYTEKRLMLKYYELMLKDILPKSLFNYYRDSVNYKFNELLIDVDFDLEWHTNGNLYKINRDEETNEIVYTNVISTSGMETIFLGLSFVYSVIELNHKHIISHIFIDELAGQLNKGKNNDDDMKTNYQEMLLLLLNKFGNVKIFIVDHVIKNMFETKKLGITYNKELKQSKYYEIKD